MENILGYVFHAFTHSVSNDGSLSAVSAMVLTITALHLLQVNVTFCIDFSFTLFGGNELLYDLILLCSSFSCCENVSDDFQGIYTVMIVLYKYWESGAKYLKYTFTVLFVFTLPPM